MITGELKSKVDRLWEMFWTGAITNPLDVIEQITYLMFIIDLDEMDTAKEADSIILGLPFKSIFPEDKQHLKWCNLKEIPSEDVYNIFGTELFPFIKTIHDDEESTYSKYMADAIFKIPTPQLLEKIITALDEFNFKDKDTKGDLYEYLLSKISTAGTNGQFRTPRHIIRMMVEMLDLNPQDVICDPACGTSGFLVSAGEYLKEKYHDDIFYNKEAKDHYNNNMFTGFDMDRTMLRIGAMNITLIY